MTAIKLGLRNLARNRWRTVLTLAAVAVAVGMMVWSLSLYEGWIHEMVRGATAAETSQVQIHTAAYVEEPRAYRAFPLSDSLLDRIARLPEVEAAAPRVVLHGLVGNERRSQVVRILGVDPVRERRATPVADAVVEGRWLSPEAATEDAPREVVLGSGVARQLQVGPGDELVTFLEAADGSLGNDLLEVVGVVRTANNRIDRNTVYTHLADAQRLGALDGEAHEIAVKTVDPTHARRTARAVAEALGARLGAPEAGGGDADTPRAVAGAEGGAGVEGVDVEAEGDVLVVRPWQEILPGIDRMILVFRRSYWIIYLLVYLLAAAGILNTQRMAALERRREFGVMMAIGMRPRRMFRTLMVETGVLALLGAALGAGAGAALSAYHATRGFDMTLLADEATFSYMGVAFSERLYFVLTPENVVEPVAIMIAVALVSGLWPAVQAARIDPAPTIAGRGA